MRYEFDGGVVELGFHDYGTYYDHELRCPMPELDWYVEDVELDCGLRLGRSDPCLSTILKLHGVEDQDLDVFFWDEVMS